MSDEAPQADLDPLAPVFYGAVDAEEPPEDESDGGVSDSDGIVRIWLEDGRLSKVRVSPVWYQRLGRRTLADCFGQALRMANSRVPEVTPRQEQTFDDVDFSSLPRFNGQALAVMQDLFDDVEVRWDDAIERYHAREQRTVTPTEGHAKGVTVRLNPSGRAEEVVFDESWLDQAQAGTISTHVQQAAESAYARFVPVPDDRSELDALEQEHEFLLATFKAMLNPKEPA